MQNGVACDWILPWWVISGKWGGPRCCGFVPVGDWRSCMGSSRLSLYSVVLPHKNLEMEIVSKDVRESQSKNVESQCLKGVSLVEAHEGT